MPANNKYICNDTTVCYVLSHSVCWARSSQAVPGRRERSSFLPSFLPPGELCPFPRSLESLKGNKHHGDNTIPSVCVNLDFVWTFGADLGLNCVKNPDWCGLTWPCGPVCPRCQSCPQPCTSSLYFTDKKEHNITADIASRPELQVLT